MWQRRPEAERREPLLLQGDRMEELRLLGVGRVVDHAALCAVDVNGVLPTRRSDLERIELCCFSKDSISFVYGEISVALHFEI